MICRRSWTKPGPVSPPKFFPESVLLPKTIQKSGLNKNYVKRNGNGIRRAGIV